MYTAFTAFDIERKVEQIRLTFLFYVIERFYTQQQLLM